MKGYITNEWDRDNLQFLLNTNSEVLSHWYDQSDEDDKVYAQELLDAYARELKLRAQELLVEAKIENCADAKTVLKKFVLQ
jgi:hypothetical protein